MPLGRIITDMFKYLVLVCVLVGGCSFDLSVLRTHSDSGTGSDAGAQQDSSDAFMTDIGVDAWADTSDTGIDAWVEPIDSGTDLGTDSAEDPDAWIAAVDAGTDSGNDSGPALTCTDVPSIAGNYRINYRLMFCTAADFGALPLTRVSACDYSFEDGTTSTNHIFNGPCTVIIEGSMYHYECSIQYSAWTYNCTLTPVSGGLNADCRFVSGISPPSTSPCSFFMPSV